VSLRKDISFINCKVQNTSHNFTHSVIADNKRLRTEEHLNTKPWLQIFTEILTFIIHLTWSSRFGWYPNCIRYIIQIMKLLVLQLLFLLTCSFSVTTILFISPCYIFFINKWTSSTGNETNRGPPKLCLLPSRVFEPIYLMHPVIMKDKIFSEMAKFARIVKFCKPI
jgi:hypothetical protein